MPGYMYILECCNGSFYAGCTNDLLKRYAEHVAGNGPYHTRKYPPTAILYFEKYKRMDDAVHREKQVRRWSRVKKEALVENKLDNLGFHVSCQKRSHCKNLSFARIKKLL